MCLPYEKARRPCIQAVVIGAGGRAGPGACPYAGGRRYFWG